MYFRVIILLNEKLWYMRCFACSKTSQGLKIFCQNSLSFIFSIQFIKNKFHSDNLRKKLGMSQLSFSVQSVEERGYNIHDEMNRFTCTTENNPPLQTPVSIKRSLSQNESEIRNICTYFAVCTTYIHSKFLENRPTLSDMASNKHRQTKSQAINVKTRPRLTICLDIFVWIPKNV